MKILTRHKDKNNRTIAYTIIHDNKTQKLPAEAVQQFHEYITNAILLFNGEFRAKEGCTIATEVDTSYLMPTSLFNTNTSVQKPNSSYSQYNFYGKNMINICKKIRIYANLGKIKISYEPHKSNNGNNLHLFELIKLCNINVDDFIIGYLSNIQPYSLEPFQGKKSSDIKNQIWLRDVCYGTVLIIKINTENKDAPLIISFHESNLNGNFYSTHKDMRNKPCAVLLDNTSDALFDTGCGYRINYTIQRGFIKYRVNALVQICDNGVALVNYNDIIQNYNDIIRNILKQLYETYNTNNEPLKTLELQFDRLSIMSSGFNTVNNICLLIELYAKYTDVTSRATMIGLLDSIISELPNYHKLDVLSAMKLKFGPTYSNKAYLFVIKQLNSIGGTN